MKSAIVKGWRNAAALVVLSPRSVAVKSDRCNYEVLLQTRGQGASFRNSVVFPGGVSEAADASADWLSLLKSFGYTQADFDSLHRKGTAVPPIFEDNPVLRHVSLRITAIRETFEELGLLVCSTARKADRSDFWSGCIEDFDIKHWQKRVSKDPSELLNLCSELNCYPDIWSIHYWSSWLTPAKAPKRFNTAFFLAALEKKPRVEPNTEVVKAEWQSPSEVLSKSEELVIYPPQVYELSLLSYWPELEQVVSVGQQCSSVPAPLFYHATVLATDGRLAVFPGDDLYPTSVDLNTYTTIKTNKTLLELRESSHTAHRIESTDARTHTLVLKNFRPKNIDMGDKVIPLYCTFS